MKIKTVDGNTAVSYVAYKLSEVIPIYPITPSSPMAEYADSLKVLNVTNIFGTMPTLIEMQSEAGVIGTLAGALNAGALSCTFTSSQGLLLMIPNMYKIAGNLLPAVIHVASRAVASHALSIFGDHQDVMATRQTGFILISSSSVQEAQDYAMISHMVAIKCSLPVLHFFDGFRTSHEIQKIEGLEESEINALYPKHLVKDFKANALSHTSPYQSGTAQNPDVYFQNREAVNSRYTSVLKYFKQSADEFEKVTNRKVAPFSYFGSKKAKNIIVAMGSACKCLEENIDETTGVISVHLYRPFFSEEFLNILPETALKIIVLDRTKECGAEAPLCLDIKSTIFNANKNIQVVGGRYGLGGKDFTPACARAVIKNFDDMKDNFSVGIIDDKSNLSLKLSSEVPSSAFEIKLFGLGSDGNVSASKSTIKIIAELSSKYVQGYFEYDSKKSGSLTISHLRIDDHEIKSSYLLNSANVIVINNFSFISKYDCLKGLKENGIVIINSIFSSEEIDKVLPDEYKKALKEKKAKLYLINASNIANENGLNGKINIIMQTALFSTLSQFDKEIAYSLIEKDIKNTFSKKGQDIVNKNLKAFEQSKSALQIVNINLLHEKNIKNNSKNDKITQNYSNFGDIIKSIQNLEGNSIPVSAFNEKGKVPNGTSLFSATSYAEQLPNYIPQNCIECGFCSIACPHNAIKAMLVKKSDVKEEDMKYFKPALTKPDLLFRILINPKVCTGCGVCANTCIAKDKALAMTLVAKQENNKSHLEKLQEIFDRVSSYKNVSNPYPKQLPKGMQFEPCYFQAPGACAGCGETPYIKLITQIFGGKIQIANATGCSSIYSGSFPNCPYLVNENGEGPAWTNSLFEDNAEFGLGLALGNKYNNVKENTVIIGGDGWAYDIGYGGLDHVLYSGEKLTILVLDSEVYSNTGGQSSKSTPTGTIAKFAGSGKETAKKNLALSILQSHRNVFVASVALGADFAGTIKVFEQAKDFDGVSIIFAYSPCVNHGFDMSTTMQEEKKAVECGFYNTFMYNPSTKEYKYNKNVDFSKFRKFLLGERRFSALYEKDRDRAEKLFEICEENARFVYNSLAKFTID